MHDFEKVLLPDIGDFSEVEIIEILVNVGDGINPEDPILTLESDKATMDVPSPIAGKVSDIHISLGNKISQGDLLITVDKSDSESGKNESQESTEIKAETGIERNETMPRVEQAASDTAISTEDEFLSSPDTPIHRPPPTLPPPVERAKGTLAHASPSVRRFARELGADLSQIRGTGPKGRVLRDDILAHVNQVLQEVTTYSRGNFVSGPPPLPEIDFAEFGEIEQVKISKIKKITGDRLHRSWLDIPHVTHHDKANITQLEVFRKQVDAEQRISGTRVTILAFICKAVINALQQFPTFNASLAPDGQSLILKKYFHIGVAVDTPKGLVVPVIRNMQNLRVLEIATILQKTGEAARKGQLTPSDFQGGCFTISSLGGIGGQFFTPIINPPEVAILGVSRNHLQAMPSNDGIDWQTMLPLSLSYDHRVIDGAEAAKFTKFVCDLLYDSRRILL